MQKNETRPPSYTNHKNKLKMNKDVNIRPQTIKILEENIGSKISGIVCSNSFTDVSPKAKETKEKIKKWDYIKLKIIYTVKEAINKIGCTILAKYPQVFRPPKIGQRKTQGEKDI